MSLRKYNQKRDFEKTAEPSGTVGKGHRKPIFVVQEHHATRLHWDFRLEADGVLKSWAVPKEPTLDPAVKRLAVQVEDHPLPYAKFHGDIPKGQYGGGHVEIWDNGTYDNLRPDPLTKQIDSGRVEFELHGKKLHGGFNLVRLNRDGEKKNWLLMKKKDGDARPGSAPAEKRSGEAASGKAPKRKSPRRAITAIDAGPSEPVALTHGEKIMFPETGYTKADVFRFYEKVAPRLLPHLKDRPITLERFPDGVGAKAPRFWQKNTPSYYPKWIPRINLPSEDGKIVSYALVNDVNALLYLVNQGTITFHPWLSRVQSLDRPDFVLFDLDPGEASFADVVEVTKLVHAALEDEGVESFVKTSGKSGLHVLVPWTQEGGYDEARAWAMSVATRVVGAVPDRATTERGKSAREGRVYVDVMQNARGHHVVPPYVLRPTPGATVSTPLEWKELTPTLDPKKFDLKTVFTRWRGKRVDPMKGIIQNAER